MTDEEIEELAENYTNSIDTLIYDIEGNAIDITKNLSKAFKDGAKWGIEHEWHDLRKCPDDLPKCAENKQILFYVKEFYTDIGKDTSHFCLGFYAKSFLNDDIKVFVEKSKGYECEHPSQEVIAWCELLTYKE